MRILTLDNTYYDLNQLPEEVDDMRFAILDNSNPAEPDYHFIPLIFLESFNAIDFERATGITTTFVQDNHSQSTKGI